MSASTTPDLDLVEKLLKIANLQADTVLKETQNRWEPWKVVVSAASAGGVVGGALVAATVALTRVLVG